MLNLPRLRAFLLSGLLLSLLLWVYSACLPRCISDSECKNNFLCGPGQVCAERCFPGQAVGCQSGMICAPSGTGCIPAPEQTVPTEMTGDAG